MCPSAQLSAGRGDEKPPSTCVLSDQGTHDWVACFISAPNTVPSRREEPPHEKFRTFF